MEPLKIIWGAILMATLTIGAVVPMALPPEVPAAETAVVLVLGVVGLAGPLLSLGWGRAFAMQMTGHARWIPRWALAETGACCALVNHLAGGPAPITVALAGLALMTVLLQFPREDG